MTGALILVAALVIVVPEMLLRPHRKTEPTDALTSPADMRPPLTTYSVALNGNGDAQSLAQSPAVVDLPPEPVAQTVEVQPAEKPDANAAGAAAESTVKVEPAPTVREAAKDVASTAVSGKWWAQLGSFKSRENAEKLARKLTAAGFAMDVTKVKAGGAELYRVRAGPAKDRSEALALQARLETTGSKSTLVAP